jgi:hypothetical protein
MDAVKLMKAAYLSTQIDRVDFAPALTEYVREHGSLAAQTPASWAEFIVDFVDERLAAHAEANSARRRGQANSVTNEDSEEDGEDYAKVFAAFIAFQNKAKAKLPAPAKTKKRLYCWTHGCIGHASGGKVKPCNNPGEGHKFEATFENQMGGKAAK